MKLLLLFLSLCTLTFAEDAPACGQPITQGTLTSYCLRISLDDAARWGAPTAPQFAGKDSFQMYATSVKPGPVVFDYLLEYTVNGEWHLAQVRDKQSGYVFFIPKNAVVQFWRAYEHVSH